MGIVLSSHRASPAIFSPQTCLTAEFGMGSGVTRSLLTPKALITVYCFLIKMKSIEVHSSEANQQMKIKQITSFRKIVMYANSISRIYKNKSSLTSY